MRRQASPCSTLSFDSVKRQRIEKYEYSKNNLDSAEHYTVGWICALQEEYECACRMLDEELTGPDIEEDRDDNTYVYGRIAKHYVVIGCLPPGRYGTNSASRVARDMLRTFPKLRFALMVGIGGGVPTAKNDIRLGDVVVSQPRDGYGGVVQYDLGKRLPDGRFQRTGQLNAPPEKLLGVTTEIQRLYNDKKKPDRIAEHIQRMSDMEDYQQPMVDRLYNADYLHVHGPSCERCDPEFLVERPERQSHRIVRIHYGTIASGNTVLKDATVRDTHANDSEMNILCFEMEAAGLMNNIPCLVIRGVCDYCDSHKNDDWHKFAALSAAAYAREVLLILRPQKVDAMPSWTGQIVHELRHVSGSIANMIDTRHLEKLSIVEGATFESYDNQHDECLKGTRTELLEEVQKWVELPDEKSIFWLNGMAGTGKSTIARTVAQSFKDKGLLGATFFFKRGEADRGNAKYLISTITRQLVIRHRGLVPDVLNAVKNDPNISSKFLSEQFDKLLYQPLLNLCPYQSTTIVIVIDALDECEGEDNMRLILQLLFRLQEIKSVHLRVFLTSRPEFPIRFGFQGNENHQDLILHKLPLPVIENDIRAFLKYKLSIIQRDRLLDINWPGNDNIERLVQMAVPLFIFASTICRYVGEKRFLPEERLKAFLEDKAGSSGTQMDKTYLPILNQLFTGMDKNDKRQLKQEFQDIVGTIILLATPLSVTALARLIGLSINKINNHLDGFHSVLTVPEDTHSPIRILHLSFRDYLLITESPFHIHERETHRKIATHCLRVMESRLKHNICDLTSYGTQHKDIDPQVINQHLTADLQYSCHYWVHHLKQSKARILESEILSFLKKRFLHWLEALALVGSISDAVEIIDALISITWTSPGTEISDLLYDAKRFTLQNTYIAGIAPLQLYCSGLVFAPAKSIVKKIFYNEIVKQIQHLSVTQHSWGASLQTLEGHSDSIWSVAFSPNGCILASGDYKGTIILWDTTTGIERQTLKGYLGTVLSLAFSPNGRTLASADSSSIKLWDTTTGIECQTLYSHSGIASSVAFSPDGRTLAFADGSSIKLWDTTTGIERQTLKGYSPLAFSPDGRTLVSRSTDNTIKLWDTTTIIERQTLKGHIGSVESVAFSSDRRTLASADVSSIILWDTITGIKRQTLYGHSGTVLSVAFSPDGYTLVSGSADTTIKLWDTMTGIERQTLKGYLGSVGSVAFSPDGRTLVSGGTDCSTIKLWDMTTVIERQTPEGHSDAVMSLAFSPDGRTLASGSDDTTIKLWDTKTGIEYQTLEGHSEGVRSLAFSPDGLTLASGSDDTTIKLWDITTGIKYQTLYGHSGTVLSLAFSPNRLTLASSDYHATIKLWDTITGIEYQTLENNSGPVRSLAFSPDGLTLASGSDDTTIKLWDITTGIKYQKLYGHSDTVLSIAFSPDGYTLVSGSADTTIKLWDTTTGIERQTLKGHSYSVPAVLNEPNSSFYISLSNTWIALGDDNLLWLPVEYRSFSCHAVKDAIIALGCTNGWVCILGFHHPQN
ncbi:WD domain protein [Aspergillus novoparasiticus]|uniref:WD domain protein n=1 Tax=Aspergillus novoparasiticus TaxID=986946 RepID=A0A5N6E656_9EURO|nr:WD domain protein [Aspergillus novoparasiticus]